MVEVKRRLTVYPGQVSMVFNIQHAKEYYNAMRESLPRLESGKQECCGRFLAKMAEAIHTAERLCAKQSSADRGVAS